MSRPSASGIPYLVLRPETGKYVYWRNLRAEIAPAVTGAVFASWLLKAHDLAGKPVVKISLKTGDKQLARQRWLEIHPQIEVLLNVATAKVKRALAPAMTTLVPVLSSGDRVAIAAQARHDVMAEDDEALVSSALMSPLARGLAAALRARDEGRLPIPASPGGFEDVLSAYLAQFPKNMSKDEIRAWARQKEAEQVSEMLKTGDFSVLDGPPAVLEEMVLDPENPGRPKVVASSSMLRELDQRLEENGLEVDDELERRNLDVAVARARAAAYQDIEARVAGKSVETPPRPLPLRAAPSGETPPALSEMHEKWVKRNRPSKKSKDDNTLYVSRFIALHGSLRVDEIKRRHVREFRDMLLGYPRAMPDAIAKKTQKEILAWAAGRKEDLEKAIAKERDPEKKRKLEDEADQFFLSRVTVNAKGIGSIAALMSIAIPEYDLSGDPCAGLLLPIAASDVLERRPFTNEHLQAMRASPVFRNPPKLTKGSGGAAAFWLPLIALYSGARMEEIGQLRLADILEQSGVPYFWFRDDDDEDEEAFDNGRKRRPRGGRHERDEGPKSMKTEASRRRVPIHRVLIELGLLEYIAARRAAGDEMLFPFLRPYRERWTKNFSRYWARYQDKYITRDSARVFHSFRHGFITVLRNANVERVHIKALVGHSRELEEELKDTKDTTDRYGDGYIMRLLNEALQKVEYLGLIFERIEQFVR